MTGIWHDAPASKIPRPVWVLGFVSLLMDLSSETIHALLPLFLTATLGASVAVVGMIDGVAEATASITKVFSGYLSDRTGKRKPLILIGYGLGAASKPVFALAGSVGVVFGARFADRIGKGLRGAPRDAMVADVTPPEIRGSAFGLRQSLDTVGAFAGPLLAIGLMLMFADNMRSVFWFALLPGVLAVMLVLFGLEDTRKPAESTHRQTGAPIRLAAIRRLDRAFWEVLGIGVVFTLARFSEAFLVLKANQEGLPLALAPLVLVLMNIVYSVGAYPAGRLADRLPAPALLAAGMVCLILADLTLGLTPGLVGAFSGIALWGLHMALTQGLFAKLVADTAPPNFRGSAYGLFNLASGVALLLASTVAGVIWDRIGSDATFLVGGGFSAVALVLLLFFVQNRDLCSS